MNLFTEYYSLEKRPFELCIQRLLELSGASSGTPSCPLDMHTAHYERGICLLTNPYTGEQS